MRKARIQKTVTVCVTAAASPLAYHLLPIIAAGEITGPEFHVQLRLLEEVSRLPALEGVVMELQDCCYPLLRSVEHGDDPSTMLAEADLVFFLGGVPRKMGISREDLVKLNAAYFGILGTALNEAAKPTTLCLVAAEPKNTNCAALAQHAPRLPPRNFAGLKLLDQQRAMAQVAKHFHTIPANVKKVIVWGDSEQQLCPDISFGKVSGEPITEAGLNQEALVVSVQRRETAIISTRKYRSSASTAQAAAEHMRRWLHGSSKWTCMSVMSEGAYGIPAGVWCGVPVTCKPGQWQIVPGLELTENTQEKLQAIYAQLANEHAFMFD